MKAAKVTKGAKGAKGDIASKARKVTKASLGTAVPPQNASPTTTTVPRGAHTPVVKIGYLHICGLYARLCTTLTFMCAWRRTITIKTIGDELGF